MLSRLPLVAGLLACLALTAQAAEAADRRFYPADVPQHSEYRAPAYRPYAPPLSIQIGPPPLYRPYYYQAPYYYYPAPAPIYYYGPRYYPPRYYRPHYREFHDHDFRGHGWRRW